MNLKFLLPVSVCAVMMSCSSSYRNTQTPDDVYYSPEPTGYEVKKEAEAETPQISAEDRQLRMARYDRRWRDLDFDYDYNYDPYRFGYAYGYYYNPYYCPSPVFNPGIRIINPKNTTPRMTNLGSYFNTRVQVFDPKTGSSQWVNTARRYNNSNNSEIRRRTLTPSSNNNENPSQNNNRSYTPSNNGGSSSGGGSKSSGSPVSRPGRG